jgi:hypothetical protein
LPPASENSLCGNAVSTNLNSEVVITSISYVGTNPGNFGNPDAIELFSWEVSFFINYNNKPNILYNKIHHFISQLSVINMSL